MTPLKRNVFASTREKRKETFSKLPKELKKETFSKLLREFKFIPFSKLLREYKFIRFSHLLREWQSTAKRRLQMLQLKEMDTIDTLRES